MKYTYATPQNNIYVILKYVNYQSNISYALLAPCKEQKQNDIMLSRAEYGT